MAPALIRRSTAERRKFSAPMLKPKEMRASTWFWVSGVNTSVSITEATRLRS